MKKRVISWLLTVVMVVSLLPTSVLADTLAADQEQQTQQEQIAPVDTENTVPAENEETQEQQEPAPETPVSRSARSGGTALALAEGTVSSAKEFAAMDASGSYTLTKDIIVTEPYASDFSGTFDGNGHTVTLAISGDSDYQALFVWGDRIFEKCGIGRDERGDGGKTLEIRGKRRLSARDGGANYQQS